MTLSQKHWYNIPPFLFGLLVCLAPSSAMCDDAPATNFSDNSLSYRYGTAFKEPSTAKGDDIIKNILQFQHFNTDSLGSNFLNIDALFSHDNDPAENSTHGATEIYGIYRRDWSLHQITGADFSSLEIIRDVALHMGGDFNTKNVTFAPEKKLLVIGPQLSFAVPVGFFNVAFDVSKEWNHNGKAHDDVSFDPAFELESSWGFPFHLYGTSWNFSGFFNYIAPKGRDGFGNQTTFEVLTRPELMLDVGELVIDKKGVFEVGGGYEYWLNKYGNDHTKVPGSLAETPELIARLHF